MAEIFAAAATLQSLRRLAGRQFGLSSSELAVLVAVSKLDGQPGIRQLADHLHLVPTNVTSDVGGLVLAGYIAKMPDPDDARAIKLSLTRSGRALVKSMAPVLRMVNDRLFSDMSHEEMTRISGLMRHVAREGRLLSMTMSDAATAAAKPDGSKNRQKSSKMIAD